jgi:four helix bundle protein
MTNDKAPVDDPEPWHYEKATGTLARQEFSGFVLKETDGGASEQPFDLAERTAKFGEAIIRFVKKFPQNPVNNRLIDQLVGCGTSVGANYCEADDAVSKKEFQNKIGTCKKEAKETKFFLRMAATAEPGLKDAARELWREAKELHLIFCSIHRSGSGR